jgi:serine phosphatase RsbU (regulator of sigma subunit)/lipoprotein NlpI
MKISGLLIAFLMSLTFVAAIAQQDSLLNRVNNLSGREKINVLLKISENTRGYAPELSLEFAEQARQNATNLQDTLLMLLSLKNIGLIYYSTSDFEKSLQYFTRILAIQQLRNDGLGVASACNNIGIIYDELKRYPTALDFYHRSLEMKEKIGDQGTMANTINNIGFLYSKLNNPTKAYEYFSRALTIDEQQRDTLGMFNTLNNIGLYYFQQQEYDSALSYFNTSLQLGAQLDNNYDKAHLINNISNIYLRRGELQEAISSFNRSLEFSEPMDAKARMINSYHGLAEAYKRLGRYRTALDYYKKQSDLKDLVYVERNQRKITEIETNYQIQQREKEIELLKKESEIQVLNLSKNRTVTYFLIVGMILIFILTSVLYQRNQYRIRSNKMLENQNREIARKNIDILDSIMYAKGIQDAIRPDPEILKTVFTDYFILSQARDIVNGDFYWLSNADSHIIVAVMDCTGHGVPGAFMTVMANSLLNQIVVEHGIESPSQILKALQSEISNTLHQEKYNQINNEGMDIGITKFNKESGKLIFAGAKRPLYYFKNNKLNVIKGNTQSIAGALYKKAPIFDEHTIELSKGDSFYLFTDGIVDQFGGPDNKKFMSWRLKHQLNIMYPRDMENQKFYLEAEISTWSGKNEQTDDILMLGVRV